MLRKKVSMPSFSKREKKEIVEDVAKLNHKEWMSWSKKLAKEKSVSAAKKKKWEKLWVDYDKLPLSEKKKDIDWAKKYVELIESESEKKEELKPVRIVDKNKKCFVDSIDLSNKKATRDGFGAGMMELGKNKNIVALTADLTGSVKLTDFAKKYPSRFFQFGISEQNMLSAAAGMTLAQKIPFVTSFAAFNPGRNWDQLRVSVCYQNSNVKIFGSHAGLTTGPDGATHQALEDIAITRCLPNLTVIVPMDSEEMRKAVLASVRMIGPVYLRGSRAATPVLSDKKTKFEIGKMQVLDKGDDVTIVACGVCVQFAIEAKKKLLESGIDASVINCATIKPLDEKTLLKFAKKTGAVVTVEEHQRIGGLGSAVSEVLSSKFPVPVDIIGVDDSFGESGEDDELLEKYGISVKEIVKRVKKVVKRKF